MKSKNLCNEPTSQECGQCGRNPQRTMEDTIGAFLTHLCYPNCGNVFWTLNVCPHCSNPNKTTFSRQPRFGQLIQCSNCNNKLYYFKCPQCAQLFYKSQAIYKMGEVSTCTQCKVSFKQVLCECGAQTILPPTHSVIEGIPLHQCRSCKKQLIFTVCPFCQVPQYSAQPLQIGQKVKCGDCKEGRHYVPCPQCGCSTPGKGFTFGMSIQCQRCKLQFQYSNCPFGCGTNWHPSHQGPLRNCHNCTKTYALLSCRKCEEALYMDVLEVNVGHVEKCPRCCIRIAFYLCSCGLMNYEDPFCSRKTCSKPTAVVDNSEVAKGVKATECKVCMDGEATMVNQFCRHCVMCEQCFRICSKNMKEKTPCPVCRAVGNYHKHVQPIYS